MVRRIESRLSLLEQVGEWNDYLHEFRENHRYLPALQELLPMIYSENL
jgi:hypothetical protein